MIIGIILKDIERLNYKTQKLFVMKKILLIASAAAIVLTACNTEKKDSLNTDKQVVFTDTSSLKQGNASTDIPTQGVNTPANVPQTTPPPPQVRTVTKVVKVYQKQAAPVATNTTTPPASVPVPSTTTTTSNPVPSGTGTTPSTGTGTGTTPSSTTTTTTTPAKNGGWSNAAKDATIGGVGGAVVGAVIGKGAKGAIIGGVLGAAGGYILGKKKDNNNKQTTTTTTTTNP